MTQNRTTNFIQYGIGLIGALYTALGVAGFLPLDFLNPMHPEGVGVHYVFNLVAINALHNFSHLVFGVTGLWAARTLRGAQLWGKIVGSVLLLLLVAGIAQTALEGFPKDQMFLGLVSGLGGKIALVTGAGRGAGQALALRRAGAHLVAVDVNPDAAERHADFRFILVQVCLGQIDPAQSLSSKMLPQIAFG